MIELCDWCRGYHETGGDFSFDDIPWRSCPEVPEDVLVPLRRVPLIIYGPNGEQFEFYRVELAGKPVVNLGK